MLGGRLEEGAAVSAGKELGVPGKAAGQTWSSRDVPYSRPPYPPREEGWGTLVVITTSDVHPVFMF